MFVIFDYFGCDLRYLIIWTSCDWRYLTAVAQFSERLGLAEAGDSAGLGEARTVRSPVGAQPGPTGLTGLTGLLTKDSFLNCQRTSSQF